MWWEFLLWGIAGGLLIEVWQASARRVFEGRGSWSSDTGLQLLAVVVRLAIAAAVGLGLHLPLEDPAPLTSFVGGALAPLFVQDVVQRTSRRAIGGPPDAGSTRSARGTKDDPPEGREGDTAGTPSPPQHPPAEDGDGQALTPPQEKEVPSAASGPPDKEGGDGR